MAEFDTIIRRGTIVDGTRTPRYTSDLAIKDGKIAQIGGLKTSSAKKELDASGLIVAPGFVDLHTHYDAQIYWDPYCTLSGWHGVTSVAIGNCGFGFAPCEPKNQERAMLTLTRNEAIPLGAMKEGMPWDWTTLGEFFDSLDRTPKGVNLVSYVPLTPLYTWVMGWDVAKSRRPNEEELKKIAQQVDEGMDLGACGWSTQVLGETSVQRDYDATPMVTDLMTDEEIFTIAKVLADRDEGLIEIAYEESGEEGRPMEEHVKLFYEKLAATSKRPILYQTVIPNADFPENHRFRLRWLDECSKKGLHLYAQGVTRVDDLFLTFEDWNLFDDAPAWRDACMGEADERMRRFQDPEIRRRLKEEYDAGIRPTLTIQKSLGGLILAEAETEAFKKYESLAMPVIAEMEGKHIVDALMDIVVAENLKTWFMAELETRQNPKYIVEVLNSPHVVPGVSDGGAHVKFSTGGSFPTQLLTWLVRDEGVVSLEDAHCKLSYVPAHFGGFKDRGYLREGVPADIVVYDLENLKALPSEVVTDLPGNEWRRIQRSEGYRWTIVNGEITLEDSKPTGATSGRFLRHGRG